MLCWEVLALAARRELPACRIAVVAGPAAMLGSRVILGPFGETLVASPCDAAADLFSVGREALVNGRPRLEAVGEGLRVFAEPLLPPPRVVILGAGHVASALVPAAQAAGFACTVVDDRPEYASPARFPGATVVCAAFAEAFQQVRPDAATFIVLAGRSHELDRLALREALRQPAAYVGMVGSRRKAQQLQAQLLEAGEATPWSLEQLRAPIGLDLNAETPAEIAVSIVAEMIAIRRGGFGGPMREAVSKPGTAAGVPAGSVEGLRVWQALADSLDRAEPCALATVVQVRGSTPRSAGASMLVTADGRSVGTVGGGQREAEIRRLCLEALTTGKPFLYRTDYLDDTDMACGGSAEVFVEPVVAGEGG